MAKDYKIGASLRFGKGKSDTESGTAYRRRIMRPVVHMWFFCHSHRISRFFHEGVRRMLFQGRCMLSQVFYRYSQLSNHGVLESGPFLDDFPLETSSYMGFPSQPRDWWYPRVVKSVQSVHWCHAKWLPSAGRTASDGSPTGLLGRLGLTCQVFFFFFPAGPACFFFSTVDT